MWRKASEFCGMAMRRKASEFYGMAMWRKSSELYGFTMKNTFIKEYIKVKFKHRLNSRGQRVYDQNPKGRHRLLSSEVKEAKQKRLRIRKVKTNLREELWNCLNKLGD
jgi:hypothetical protein